MIKRISIKTTASSVFKYPLKARINDLLEFTAYVKKLPKYDEEIGDSIKKGAYYTEARKTNKINPNNVRRFYFKQIINLCSNIFLPSIKFDEKFAPTRGLSIRTEQIIYNRKLRK